MENNQPPSADNQSQSTPPSLINPNSVMSQTEEPQPTTSTLPTDTTNSASTYLTGSQMQQIKVPLPVGIYIIAGFNLIGFIVGFYDTSQNSALYTITLFIDLLLAIGLLLRLEAARKTFMWLTGITLFLTSASFYLLLSLQQKIQLSKTNYEAAISKLDRSKLTETQKQTLSTLQAAITVKEKQAGKAVTFTYIKLGATAVETIAVMVYLTRPKVKEVFHKLET